MPTPGPGRSAHRPGRSLRPRIGVTNVLDSVIRFTQRGRLFIRGGPMQTRLSMLVPLMTLIAIHSPDALAQPSSIQPILECRSLQAQSFAFDPAGTTSSIKFPPGWSETSSDWKSIALLSTTNTPEGVDVVQTMSAVRLGSRDNAKEFRVHVFSDDQVMVSAVYVTSIVTFNFFRLAKSFTWGLVMTASWPPYAGSQAHSLMVVSTDCH